LSRLEATTTTGRHMEVQLWKARSIDGVSCA
jgi:hypothetical protein